MYEYVRTILVNLACHGVDKIVIRPRKTNARSLFATFFAGAEVFVVALTYRNDIAVGVTFEKFFNLFRNGVRGFVAREPDFARVAADFSAREFFDVLA